MRRANSHYCFTRGIAAYGLTVARLYSIIVDAWAQGRLVCRKQSPNAESKKKKILFLPNTASPVCGLCAVKIVWMLITCLLVIG